MNYIDNKRKSCFKCKHYKLTDKCKVNSPFIVFIEEWSHYFVGEMCVQYLKCDFNKKYEKINK
jgi:hypothetical protein